MKPGRSKKFGLDFLRIDFPSLEKQEKGGGREGKNQEELSSYTSRHDWEIPDPNLPPRVPGG